MIRHQVYFDTLGSMKEGSPSWRSVFAGLSVLRLVDTYDTSVGTVTSANWAQLHSVRAAIEEMSDGDVIRGVLTAVLDAVTARNTIDDNVCVALLAYGRALDYEASWGLAVDVFSTVAKLVKPERNPKLAVEANVAVGGAARRNGDWEISGRAYSQAAYIADTLGDRPGVLTVQIGIANTYLAKGNLPQAQTILDDVIVQARDQNLPELQADALHARSALVYRQGKASEGLAYAHEALKVMTRAGSRDVLLGDIAAMLAELGFRDAARDAHLLLSATAQSKVVRWSAYLNLMELASLDGDEESFRRYARELANAPLGPWIRSHYLLTIGEAFQRFGQMDLAVESLEEAAIFAEVNQIHQIAFKAQSALEAARSKPLRPSEFVPPLPWVPDEVSAVRETI
ncbi:MAG TPA: hypothetical protein VEV81_08220, partial [Pyrinomonadaceae bacterium]|nr:hypothetical protein [Pyrinomonadaceae bacterium]